MSDASREAPSPPAAEPAPTTSPGGDDEQPPAAEDQPNNPAAHPPFEPLFTLLTNTSTNTTIHPRVHYLFSDDDPSMLTSAVAAATSTTTSTDNPRDRALIDVEALMEDFRRRMGVLGRVVGEGERRGLALRRQQEEQEVREGEASSPAAEMTTETRTDGG
ncbi:hypothetical protein ACRE_026920 [Hapsidospora chrysogenum ATCC 11550]|uniref:Uncharacterized protein n=1 Tax=Hapsidospora chrysogenum (strain ATCC 11550 / CBS 779.69 / DSM 880 / IAM 14645 / JCM 23072 / IMI 49137) TaxID=857340 RepID=A0A086TAQ0_HAPC1|nr:hypothetical protein ACRE_026920 [Hapsidospora chrysogenum ATCC 11550]